MICKGCREAGNLLVAVDLSYDFIDEGDIKDAEELHKTCEAPSTCPCQHSTKPLVRKT